MTAAHSFAGIAPRMRRLDTVVRQGAGHLAPIALRLALATPFFLSGLTRWSGWFVLSPATTYLFEEEFKLHVFGRAIGFPWPDLIAYLVALSEIGLPTLLVLGIGTRFVALALLIMTGVIELVVPEGGTNFHIHWAAEALAVMALGAGPLSIDAALGRMSPGARGPGSA